MANKKHKEWKSDSLHQPEEKELAQVTTARTRGDIFWNCEIDGNIMKALNLALDEGKRHSLVVTKNSK